VVEITGAFEIHLTVEARHGAGLAAFAERHGVKFVHIVLDRGRFASQPMLTLPAHGTLDDARAVARQWQDRLAGHGTATTRVKIEAAPWCEGLPQTDADGAAEPFERYFEHHVKLALPAAPVAALKAATDAGAAHGARLSRNARHRTGDGGQHRFLTQRCRRVGLATATARLDRLVADLRAAGLEIVKVEQEYVVEDSNLEHDAGWLGPRPEALRDDGHEQAMRSAPAGSEDYPPTYRPLPAGDAVRQTAAFDPALKQYPNAYRAGEPAFADEGDDRRWRRARRAALEHALRVIARSRWAGHLVLRGSVTMAALVREFLGAEFAPESVLALTIDWPNFTDEYPWAGGTAEQWRWRLALALETAWT
jgi:hypothetical protein